MTRSGFAVFLLIGIFVSLVVPQARMNSATYDETSHLPAGYSYLRWADFRMNPEHPPLVKELAALPLLFQKIWPDQVERTGVANDSNPIGLRTIQRAWVLGLFDSDGQWFFGRYLLYGVRDEALQRLGVSAMLAVPPTASLEKGDFHNRSEERRV